VPHEPCRSCSHDITHIGERISLALEFNDLRQRSDRPFLERFDPIARILEHGRRMERNVRPTPGILSGGQVIRIGFACDLEYRRGNLVLDGWFVEEPFGVRPTLKNGSGRLDTPVEESVDTSQSNNRSS
jgi:hypothetical protein